MLSSSSVACRFVASLSGATRLPQPGPTRLSTLDLALVAVYLAGITLFGLRFSRSSMKKEGSLKSYFLAGNTIPWWAIALSIVSAETSTLTIISIPGVAFAGNLGFLQVVLGYMLGRIVVALLFLPRYFRGEMLTAYQLIDQRFGPTLHKLTAGLFLLTRAAAEGVRVFAISIVVGIAIGTRDVLSIAIISALTLVYTFEGGLAAVIWTDVVQMALYVAGTLVALLTLGDAVPGGWTHIHAVAAPLGKFQWLDFGFSLSMSYTFWAGLLGGTFLTMASHGTDQLMVQRMLAARNLRGARTALLGSGVVIFVQFALFLVIGVGLFVFYGGKQHLFASSDRIFPTFIVAEMPHGVAGLLIAAILAAAMSNLSAALNSLASTTVVDFYLPIKRSLARSGTSASQAADASERAFVSRAATVFWALVLFAVAVYSIQAGGKGHVVETGLSIASVAYGCLLGVFLLGILTRYASETGAILGMIFGLTLNLVLWLVPNGNVVFHPDDHPVTVAMPHIAFTWYVLIGALTTFVAGSLASLVFRRRPAAITAAVVVAILAFLKPAPSQSALSMAASWTRVGLPPTPVSATLRRHPEHSDYPLAGTSPRSRARMGPPRSTQQDSVPPAAGAQTNSYDFTPVSTILNAAIAAQKLPGAVVVIGHNGQVVFQQAYGNRALEPNVEPMTEDTIFDMASLTKVLVTTTAVLQLYEQHKLDLDLPVAHYVPEFASNGKDKITIRQLLTHYSGLPEDVDLKDAWGLAALDKAEGIRRAMNAVPYGPPGVTFKYSDINFITLGALVEAVSGESLSSYAEANIFNPIAMKTTAFHLLYGSCGSYSFQPDPYGHEISHPPMRCSQSISWPLTRSIFDHLPIAPTAYDDQGAAVTNPDFNHMLRGTVHDPTTRRMGGVAGHAGVFSTAADTARFAQALLDKLLHNTGPFPLSQATLRMATGPNQPATAAANATIFTQTGKTTKDIASRGLGWDLNSPFSRPRGSVFPITTAAHPGSFGHTGFTGTSLWIDPTSDTYVILLSNAVHPRGAPPISGLRGEVATAAAQAIRSADLKALRSELKSDYKQWTEPTAKGAAPERATLLRTPLQITRQTPVDAGRSAIPLVRTGIDVLEATQFAELQKLAATHAGHLRLGLLTNQTGLDAAGHRTVDILTHAGHGLSLQTIFTPEHGLFGQQDTEHLIAEHDATIQIPIVSLYGPKASDKHPKPADLRNLDAVIIDLQDAGVRFYTYETLVGYFLEACARAKIPLIILDRPNPIGQAVQGPLIDSGRESYTAFMPLPVRHGMTLGELARFFNANAEEVDLNPQFADREAVRIGPDIPGQTGNNVRPPALTPGLHADLTVISMKGWRRDDYFDQTGLPFTPPSPNLRSVAAEILYPALGLVETTNVSVGRGSRTPFEELGAPWLDAQALKTYLDQRRIPGVRFIASTIAIADDQNHYPGHGQTIPALHLDVTDRTAFDSPECGLELLSALHHLYPKQFELDRAQTLLANAAVLNALKAGDDPRSIDAGYAPALAVFHQKRAGALLYH